MLRDFNNRSEMANIERHLIAKRPKVLDTVRVQDADYLGVLEVNRNHYDNDEYTRELENSTWRIITLSDFGLKKARIDLTHVKITDETIPWIRVFLGAGDFNREVDRYPREFIDYICTKKGKLLPVYAVGVQIRVLYLFWFIKNNGKFQNYLHFKRGKAPLVDRQRRVHGEAKFIGLKLPLPTHSGSVYSLRYIDYIYAAEFDLLSEHPRQTRLLYNESSVPHAIETYKRCVTADHHTQAVELDGGKYWVKHETKEHTYGIISTVNFLGVSIGLRVPSDTKSSLFMSMMRIFNEEFKELDKFIRGKDGTMLTALRPKDMLRNWLRYHADEFSLEFDGYERPEPFSPIFALETSKISVLTLKHKK